MEYFGFVVLLVRSFKFQCPPNEVVTRKSANVLSSLPWEGSLQWEGSLDSFVAAILTYHAADEEPEQQRTIYMSALSLCEGLRVVNCLYTYATMHSLDVEELQDAKEACEIVRKHAKNILALRPVLSSGLNVLKTHGCWSGQWEDFETKAEVGLLYLVQS